MDNQLGKGEKGEQCLDRHFSKRYDIDPVDGKQQRQGIDRIWTHKGDGREYTVEYKTDSRTAETGNVFIETMSVDTEEKLGWAYTSKAQLLVYYVPQCETAYTGTAYIVEMTKIKKLLPKWSKAYKDRVVSVPNGDENGVNYHTWGILVPLAVFESLCPNKKCIIKIPRMVSEKQDGQ